jgi:hypothetical protein
MGVDGHPRVVALADTRWVGHHPTFFRECTASLRRLGCFVIALCPHPEEMSATDVDRAERLVAPNQSLVGPLEHDPATTLLRWWATRRALDRAEHACARHTELVFFPYLDNYLRGLPFPPVPDLVLGRPWSGLYFRNQHLAASDHSLRGRLRRCAKGDRLLTCRSALPLIAVLDERFYAALARRTGRTALTFPDITDESAPGQDEPVVDALRQRAAGRPIIGMAGSLEKRKGLLTFLRTAEASAAAGDAWFFAAIGTFADATFTAEERAWIDTIRHRLTDLVFVDMSRQRIPDGAVYNAVVSSFAVSWAAYEDFQGSSNSLTKAALFDKPVVATAGECIGARVESHALGATFPERDHLAAHAAIARVLAEENSGTARRGYAAYRHLHSRSRLDAAFERLLASLPTPASSYASAR